MKISTKRCSKIIIVQQMQVFTKRDMPGEITGLKGDNWYKVASG